MSRPQASTLMSRNRRLHMRAGLIALPLLALILVSGVALNHSDDMGLAEIPLPAMLAHALYGFEAEPPLSFEARGKWVTQMGEEIYLDDARASTCTGALRGAVRLDRMIVLLCAGALDLLTPDGKVIERIGTEQGVPPGVDQIGSRKMEGHTIYLRTGSSSVAALDLDSLSVNSSSGTEVVIAWSVRGATPPALARTLPDSALPPELHVERLLLDLHSGRLFGRAGVLVVDLISLVVALLLISGCAMWYARR